MLSNEGDRLSRVVVSTPRDAYFDVGTHEGANIPELADRELTIEQHDSLKATMADFGCEVIDVPELAGDPNSVFTRDIALSTPRGHIKLRMGLAARRGEETWMSEALEALGEPCVGEIAAPGTVEGGDVTLMGTVAFVGLTLRTNEEGTKQLDALLSDMGYEIRIARLGSEWMHIGGPMSAIEVDPRGPSTGNVICLADNEVIANAAENAPVIAKLERGGVKVHGLDLSEFRKGAGGPSCLVLPVERG
jgi:dimethylargininase